MEATDTATQANSHQEVNMIRAQVGKPAPDFEAPSYYRGEFGKVKLSDYLGKWVLVCFYPGDFTYV
jgi:peroxiredoxin (alkyl hydroperoxide reductase subunit C)